MNIHSFANICATCVLHAGTKLAAKYVEKWTKNHTITHTNQRTIANNEQKKREREKKISEMAPNQIHAPNT